MDSSSYGWKMVFILAALALAVSTNIKEIFFFFVSVLRFVTARMGRFS